MSSGYVFAALRAKVGSSAAKLVLIKLADNANDEGTCYPSLKCLSEHTELSKRSVQNGINHLVENGFVKIQHRVQDGVNLPNIYHLNPNMLTYVQAKTQDVRGYSKKCHTGIAGDAIGVWQEVLGGIAGGATKPINETININQVSKNLGQSPSDDLFVNDSEETQTVLAKHVNPIIDFEAFWQSYPKRVGKLDAEKAYRGALKRASPEEIISGASRYATATIGKDRKYIAYPATWLNQGRWMDEEQPTGENYDRNSHYGNTKPTAYDNLILGAAMSAGLVDGGHACVPEPGCIEGEFDEVGNG